MRGIGEAAHAPVGKQRVYAARAAFPARHHALHALSWSAGDLRPQRAQLGRTQPTRIVTRLEDAAEAWGSLWEGGDEYTAKNGEAAVKPVTGD